MSATRDRAVNRNTGFLTLATLAVLLALTCRANLAAPADSRKLRRTPVVQAVEKVRDAVVNISTEQVIVRRSYDGFFGPGGDAFDRLFEEFFRRHSPDNRVVERRRVKQPLGSGCIITPDGLVVTNEHVIRRASNIRLSLASGETYDAKLLAADPEHDLALLRAEADKPLPAIAIGSSSDLMLGETIIALGNPFGFESSVTTGVVSAFNRKITIGSGSDAVQYKKLIQTSALINPGNSGGPLVNVLGELVGINTAVVSQAQGIGFAIPIDSARDYLAPLLATRNVAGAWSGIKAATAKSRNGVVVTEVAPKGPAADLLKTGDRIYRIDNAPVGDLFDFALVVAERKPGDRLRIRYRRNGKERTATLRLAPVPKISAAEIFAARCGIEGKDLNPSVAQKLKMHVDFGVFITNIKKDGPAADSGLEPGDVIIQVGAQPVRNLQDAGQAVLDLRAGSRVLIVIVRGRYKAFTRITLAKSPPI